MSLGIYYFILYVNLSFQQQQQKDCIYPTIYFQLIVCTILNMYNCWKLHRLQRTVEFSCFYSFLAKFKLYEEFSFIWISIVHSYYLIHTGDISVYSCVCVYVYIYVAYWRDYIHHLFIPFLGHMYIKCIMWILLSLLLLSLLSINVFPKGQLVILLFIITCSCFFLGGGVLSFVFLILWTFDDCFLEYFLIY